MKLTGIILFLFFLTTFSKADDSMKNAFSSEQEAYNLLLNDQNFCFSGLGASGHKSKEIVAIKNILASPHAVEQLISLYEKGSTAAKLYSLIGLWHLKREEFSSRAEEIKKENPQVSEISGCDPTPYPRRVADIVAAIKGNVFEWHLKEKAK